MYPNCRVTFNLAVPPNDIAGEPDVVPVAQLPSRMNRGTQTSTTYARHRTVPRYVEAADLLLHPHRGVAAPPLEGPILSQPATHEMLVQGPVTYDSNRGQFRVCAMSAVHIGVHGQRA